MEYAIPLKNKQGIIIDYTHVDDNKYEYINKYSWTLDIKKNKVSGKENKYACGWVEGIKIYMHRFLLGKSDNEEECVIDHIDNNGLNNRISNLKHSTLSANGQNTQTIHMNKTSQYLGVSSINKSWRARQGNKHIGTYKNEKDAAIAYDKYVMIKYGESARTNNLVKFQDISDNNLNDIIISKSKPSRNLPKNIYNINGEFKVRLNQDKKIKNLGTFKNLDDAIKVLSEFKKKSTEITINSDNIPYIKLNNSNDQVLVDHGNWYSLSNYNWVKCDKFYAKSTIKKEYMHRIIMNAKPDEKVDHINHNKLDNRKENLRISTSAQNNHNRPKSPTASSKYYGVCWNKRCKSWETFVHFNNKKYNCGYYSNEIHAAEAYNAKATELYGNFAKLNKFDNNYPDDVIANLSEIFDKIDINE